MKVKDIVSADLKIVGSDAFTEKEISGIYCSDMLSMVLGNAIEGNVLITIQNHINTIAIAALLDLSGVIFAHGNQPNHEMIQKAEENGISLLVSNQSAVSVIKRLLSLGVDS